MVGMYQGGRGAKWDKDLEYFNFELLLEGND
jgi:hypothetical protein